MKFLFSPRYRTEIDGLRAYAVLAVFIFHLEIINTGYLGVDVFFVISGYLITGNIFNQLNREEFSLKDFYIRRIKRILPLVSFICIVSLLIGIITMLPDDLENLSQSIVATNLFNNNLLLLITTRDYWDITNHFKPLMHTWSLGVEEQFYFIFPFVLMFLHKLERNKLIKWILALSLGSFILNFLPFSPYQKFYLLPFRFYELSFGGLVAIIFNGKVIKNRISYFFIIALFFLLFFEIELIPESTLIPIVILITCIILSLDFKNQSLNSYLLDNRVLGFIGKISFSIYMWHQLILAFARYFFLERLDLINSIFIFIITIILSTLTYYYIETPFRRKFRTKWVLVIVFTSILTTTLVSLFIYSKSGVIKDFPELDFYASGNKTIKSNIAYNEDVREYDLNFKTDKLKVLVVGDSFARDWCNVLMESNFSSYFEISYVENAKNNSDFELRKEKANIIFLSRYSRNLVTELSLNEEKTFGLGSKKFGSNNGFYYNNRNSLNYCEQRTYIDSNTVSFNQNLKAEWGNNFVDLMEPVLDYHGKVQIFDSNCKFISQDTEHLTKAGAIFYANYFDRKEDFILNRIIKGLD